MPVLSPEPFVFPEDLLGMEGAESYAENEQDRWWVLHTRPRSEKALARQLLRRGISFFLPLQEHKRRIQRRLVRSQLPLFPGYLFFLGDDESRWAALETNFVVNSLHVENQQQLSDDLVNLYNVIQTGTLLSPEARLQPGMPAEIVSGPLAGYRGRVIRRQGSHTLKFTIEVQFLQQGASVEVDSSMVRAL